MELGPIQKTWIKSMREHPERQMTGWLGRFKDFPGDYKACCLGELHICYRRENNIELKLNVIYLEDGKSLRVLEHYQMYGLRGSSGEAKKMFMINGINYGSLALANDKGATWPEIADAVEKDPENFFNFAV